MPVKIRSVRKCVDDNGVKALVHAPAGAGKTVLCATFGDSTLIISSEKGLLSIRDAPSYVKAAEVQTLDDLDEIYNYLLENAENPDFNNVCLDSISDIAEAVLAYEKLNNKDPRAAYGNLQDHVLRILRDFRDLPHYNVLMTCKQERISTDGVSLFMPMMPGAKLAQQIPYLFDEVFALRVEKDEDKNEYRVLQTSRDGRYEAKDRSGVLDQFEKPNMKKIIRKIKSGIETVGSTTVVLEEAEEKAVKVEDASEAKEAEKATKTMYGYHAESDSYFKVAKGEPIPPFEDDILWMERADWTQKKADAEKHPVTEQEED